MVARRDVVSHRVIHNPASALTPVTVATVVFIGAATALGACRDPAQPTGADSQSLALSDRSGGPNAPSYVATDLGTLGGTSSEAYAINNNGEIVGLAQTAAGVWRAFFRTATGAMLDIGDFR